MIGCQTAGKMVTIPSGRQTELAHRLIVRRDMVAQVGTPLPAAVGLVVLLIRTPVIICLSVCTLQQQYTNFLFTKLYYVVQNAFV